VDGGGKAALMAEVEAEGGQVSMVARRHGISKSLLYNWRSAWNAAALVRGRRRRGLFSSAS
jgi:transposase